MKTVLITGGLSGIGSALADIFIAAGFLVVVTSRQLSFSDSFKKPLIKQHLDVCDKSSVDKLFAWLDKNKQ
jgi:short-subunit dehydrogenase involved in D-alanine esterification of teichoic acids